MIFSDEKKVIFEVIQLSFQAKIIFSPEAFGDIFIPRTITFQNQEFTITTIDECSFKRNHTIQSVTISEESELSVICQEAFYSSSLTNISIPASVTKIGENAFAKCKYIQNITISPNSPLCSIEKGTFSFSSIKTVILPSNIKTIGEEAFSYCNRLISISFPKDSKLESIGKNAFLYSSIKNFFITSKLTKLFEGWCRNTTDLNRIEISTENKNFIYVEDKFLIGKTDQKSDVFDFLLFVRRDIKEVKIPSYIKKIDLFAFSSTYSLLSVGFE